MDRRHPQHHYLLFSLSFLYHIPSNFDSWGQDGSGEICHINPHKVANFLSSCVRKKNHFSYAIKEARCHWDQRGMPLSSILFISL